jgi:hypothetical protein
MPTAHAARPSVHAHGACGTALSACSRRMPHAAAGGRRGGAGAGGGGGVAGRAGAGGAAAARPGRPSGPPRPRRRPAPPQVSAWKHTETRTCLHVPRRPAAPQVSLEDAPWSKAQACAHVTPSHTHVYIEDAPCGKTQARTHTRLRRASPCIPPPPPSWCSSPCSSPCIPPSLRRACAVVQGVRPRRRHAPLRARAAPCSECKSKGTHSLQGAGTHRSHADSSPCASLTARSLDSSLYARTAWTRVSE